MEYEYYEVRIKDVNNINKKIFEIPKGVAGRLKPSDSCGHSRLSQKEELEKIFDDWTVLTTSYISNRLF